MCYSDRWKPCRVAGCGRETKAMPGTSKPDDLCMKHWAEQAAAKRDNAVAHRVFSDAKAAEDVIDPRSAPPLALLGQGDYTRVITG